MFDVSRPIDPKNVQRQLKIPKNFNLQIIILCFQTEP